MRDDVKEHFSWEDDFEEKEEAIEEPEERKEAKAKKEKKVKKKKKARKKKKRNIKKYIWFSIILIIAVSLFIVYKDSIFPKEGKVKTVAVVNGELITSEQLDTYYKLFVPEQIKSVITKDFFLEDSLISEILLMQEAKKEGIFINDEEVEFYINNLIARLGITKNAFISDLEREGLSFDDIKEAYRIKITTARFLEEKISSNIEVTEQEIKDYYNNNKEEFYAKEGQIRVSHILVKTKEEAESILEELKQGADFKENALEKSIDSSARINKGELGFISKGDLVPEFEEAAFSLKVREFSEPVKSSFGYHIIKRENDKFSFEDAKDSINLSLFMAKQQSVLETYINQLKSKADIELYPEDVVVEELEREITFRITDDEICKENEKPVIRLFSAMVDPHSGWISDTFNKVVKEYGKEIVAHNWQIDTGDDLLTEETEQKIPREEFDIYKKYNDAGSVPTFIFGCKYVRIGNGYEEEGSLEKEEAEFREVIEELI